MTAELIASTLETAITTGEIAPGSDLIQSDLAKRFDVSRIPVRDALRLLAAAGLVTITPNRGARVIQLTPDDVREIFDLRILLECDCLNRAIANMTATDIDGIEHVRKRSDLDAVTEDWADGDWSFHKALYAPAGRHRQLGIIETLRRTCRMHIAVYRSLPSRTPTWLKDHADLVKLCRNGETEAAVQVLQSHIAAAGQTLIDAMTG